MPFAKFSNLDFDQIRTQIKDYLRANSNFTDFDFEGSNFSVLIDTLAYNTYISAFNSNLVVNESFLDSATLRENVVSLARNIGYVPRSKTAARASILFQVQTNSSSPTLTLQPGLVCTGAEDDTTFVFSISESITTVVNNGIAQFGTSESPVDVLEGTFLTNQFIVDGSLEQRFILDNGSIDSSSIVVYVKGSADHGLGKQYKLVDNIVNVSSSSETYLIQEIQDERYELLFGDGIFGRKPDNGAVITVQYVVTSGSEGNGPSSFNFAGSFDFFNSLAVASKEVSTSLIVSSRREDNLPAFADSLLPFLDPNNAVAPSAKSISPPYTFIIPSPTTLTVLADTILVDTELVTSTSGASMRIFSFAFILITPFLPSLPVAINSIF